MLLNILNSMIIVCTKIKLNVITFLTVSTQIKFTVITFIIVSIEIELVKGGLINVDAPGCVSRPSDAQLERFSS